MSRHETVERERPVGAVEQLARDDVERKRFLKMAGRRMGGGAAAAGLAAFIAACGGSSSSSSSRAATSSRATAAGADPTASSTSSAAAGFGDLAIVNYALTLEYLESQFYADVIETGLFHGKTLSVLKDFGMDENEHVAALHKVAVSLGTPATKPTAKFPLTSAAAVTKLAGTVENLGAAAYLGQAGNIQSKEILAAALSIHSIEARHAATLNTLLKQSPTPDGAFAKPMTMAQVLAVVKPFIV